MVAELREANDRGWTAGEASGVPRGRLTEVDVRAASDRAGLRRLFARLGYQTLDIEIPPETFELWGLRPQEATAIAGAAVIAGRSGFRVLLLEVDREPSTAWLHAVIAGRVRRDRSCRELVVVATAGYGELVLCTRCVGQEPLRVRKLLIRRPAPFRTDVEALGELAVTDAGASASAIAFQVEAALDRERVTDRFFKAFRRVLDTFKKRLKGLPASVSDREAKAHRFCLLTLNRLVFLYFIQKKGWLNGDRAYLPGLARKAASERRPFFEVLKVLFFGVLNTPVAARSPEARQLGRFPYLNGGLFEPDSLERSHPELALDDATLAGALGGLLEKFRFTVREDSELEQEAGVDPEMLGKVFENLMDSGERGRSGSFYTPKEVVVTMVREALTEFLISAAEMTPELARRLIDTGDAIPLDRKTAAAALASLESARILDPAVGSGAFLLGMLSELARAQEALSARLELPPEPDWSRRRRILHRNLYGVDINGTAVKLCDLRLWLALTVDMLEERLERVPPLPNLDHKVKQGNALLSPLDCVDPVLSGSVHGRLREKLGDLVQLKDDYEKAAGPAKRAAAEALAARERRIALDVLDWRLGVLEEKLAGWTAATNGCDLFGARPRLPTSARRELDGLRRRRREVGALRRRLIEGGDLPSFSFEIHFAEALAQGGFDIVIGNPPWVRLSQIGETERTALHARYDSKRSLALPDRSTAGETPELDRSLARPASLSSGQVDLSALFLDRSMELTRTGGILSLLLPSKLFTTLSNGGFRKALVERWRIARLADHSLARRRIFRADTFPLILTAVKTLPELSHEIQVELRSGVSASCEFTLPQRQLEGRAPGPDGRRRERAGVPDENVTPGLPLASSQPPPKRLGASGAPWLLAPPAVRGVLEKMDRGGASLGDRYRPSMGLKTGANAVYVVDECAPGSTLDRVRVTTFGFRCPEDDRQRRDYTAEVERRAVRPLIRGEGLEVWKPYAGASILWRDPLVAMPRLERYLRRHGIRKNPPLAARASECRLDSRHPFVVWKDIGRKMSAAVVDEPMDGPAGPAWPVPLNTTNFISTASSREAHFLAGLLNSLPVRTYLASMVPRAKDGYFRFPCWSVALVPLPAPWVEDERLARISQLARSAAAGRVVGADIDAAVSDLFGLDAGERRELAAWSAYLTAR